MPVEPVHESQVAWNPERPDTLVITCVDGRWRHHVQDFVAGFLRADAHADIVAVPGSIEPLTLADRVPKDFNFLRRRLEALVRTHGTQRIVAIAHQDCAWYRDLKLTPDATRERQIRDLAIARKRLAELFPEVTIETYFTRLTDGEPRRVVFDRT